MEAPDKLQREEWNDYVQQRRNEEEDLRQDETEDEVDDD